MASGSCIENAGRARREKGSTEQQHRCGRGPSTGTWLDAGASTVATSGQSRAVHLASAVDGITGEAGSDGRRQFLHALAIHALSSRGDRHEQASEISQEMPKAMFPGEWRATNLYTSLLARHQARQRWGYTVGCRVRAKSVHPPKPRIQLDLHHKCWSTAAVRQAPEFQVTL